MRPPLQSSAPAVSSHFTDRASRMGVLLPAALLAVAAVTRLAALADVPPGLQHDEVFKTMFVEQVRAGEFPVFFDLNGGNEPFFAYLVTGTLALFGPNFLALRLPAVAGGLIGVAGLWWVARRMWGVRVAALAVLLMSVSLWHVMDSRVSLRAIWLPAVMTLGYGFLWDWWRSRRWGRLLLGTLLLGLSLYTYTSAVLGVLAVLALGAVTVLEVGHRRAGTGLIASAALALAMGIPLVLHLAQVPEATVRVRDLNHGLEALRAGDPLPVLTSSAKVAAMFAFTGDPEWRYNVAGRPVFTLGVGLAFYAGVWACWRGRRLPQCRFLLLWLVVNLGASAVTSSAPSSLRAVGAAPAAYVLAGVGCWWLWDGAARRGWRLPATAVLALAVGLEATSSLHGYFVTWPAHPEVREIYRADLADLGRYLGGSGWADEVMVSTEYAADLDRLSFEYLGFSRAKPRYFDGGQMLVVPAQPSLVLVPRMRAVADSLAPVLEKRGQQLAGEEGFEVWQLDPRAEGAGEESFTAAGAESPDCPAEVLAPWPGPALRILAVHLPEEVAAGEDLEAVVRFEVTAPAPGGRNVKLFAHLRDGAGFLWSQADVLTYPSSDWRMGDEVYQVLRLPVPSDMPGGSVSVDIGVYEDAAQPFPLLLGEDRVPFTRLRAGASRVAGGGADLASVAPEVRLDALAEGARLVGVTPASRIVQPGGDLEVSLWWTDAGAQAVPIAWTLRRDGAMMAVREAARGSWEETDPTAVIRDKRRLTIPASAERGEWNLVAVEPGDGQSVDLGPVFVAGVERDFAAPAASVVADVEFGGGILLAGLSDDVAGARQGEVLEVELLWRCLTPLDRDYTVFVQVVDGDGRVVASHDGPPAGASRPTRGWLPGEVVRDGHALVLGSDVPPGAYSLIAGLYLADVPGYPRLGVSRAGTPAGADSAIIASIEVVE